MIDVLFGLAEIVVHATKAAAEALRDRAWRREKESRRRSEERVRTRHREEVRTRAVAREIADQWRDSGRVPAGKYSHETHDTWILAALMLGEDGHAFLTRIVNSTTRLRDDLRLAAMDELVRRFRKEAPALLEWTLADPADRIRVAAVTHLGKLRHRASAPAIVRALSRLNEEGRIEAAHALSRMGATEQVGSLLGLLRDPSPRIRDAAADALGWIGTIKVVPSLRKLESESGERAIGRIQARAKAEGGRVSISSDDRRGRLSPAKPKGAVSEPRK